MIEAHTAKDVAATYKACVRTWRLQCQAVIDRLEEGGSRLFTFLQSPPDQGKSIRTTNAIERRPEACKRRIQTPCLLPCAETAGLRFWAVLASGQSTLRRVDGWNSLNVAPPDEPRDRAARAA